MIRVEVEPGMVWVDMAGRLPYSVGEWAWVGRVDRYDLEADRRRRESIRRALEAARRR